MLVVKVRGSGGKNAKFQVAVLSQVTDMGRGREEEVVSLGMIQMMYLGALVLNIKAIQSKQHGTKFSGKAQ